MPNLPGIVPIANPYGHHFEATVVVPRAQLLNEIERVAADHDYVILRCGDYKVEVGPA